MPATKSLSEMTTAELQERDAELGQLLSDIGPEAASIKTKRRPSILEKRRQIRAELERRKTTDHDWQGWNEFAS